MIIAMIVTGILTLVLGILWISGVFKYSYGDRKAWPGVLSIVFAFICFVAFLFAWNWSPSTENLTGYIYSADTAYGYTSGHIRFSEQAGTDAQPSFCAKADSVPGKQIVELAGSGKKVKVNIPPYNYFANNPFACGTTETTIQVVN